MKFLLKSILFFSFHFCSLGLISCAQTTVKTIEPRQAEGGDLIEVTGTCEKDGKYEPCPVTNIPKYMRQLIVFDRTLSYGETPNTISSFVILKHIKNGYLIDGLIGYKYLKGRGNPGRAPLATTLADINLEATIYEIFTNKVDAKFLENFGLDQPFENVKIDKNCYLQKYSRKKEPVVVVVQTVEPAEATGITCSAYGHLYYFGINFESTQDYDTYFKTGKSIATEVIFDKPKIIKKLSGAK